MSMDSRSELILKLLQKMQREGAARYMEGVPALRSEDVQQGCCPSAVNIVLIADVPDQVSCYQNCPIQNFSRINSATLKYL